VCWAAYSDLMQRTRRPVVRTRCAVVLLACAPGVMSCEPSRTGDPASNVLQDAGDGSRGVLDAAEGERGTSRLDGAHDAKPRPPDALTSSADGSRMAMRCDREEPRASAAIATAALRAAPPVPIVVGTELMGEGLAQTLTTQQNATAGLRFEQDRAFLLTDVGFWDLPRGGEPRWYPTSSTLLLAARALDLDADGDRDLLLVSNDILGAAQTDPSASPLVTRVTAWERTPDGLEERGEVLSLPYGVLPLPYDAGDLDGDGDLDVVSYERGTPVGYLHDGAFHFTRAVLGETAPQFADKLLAFAYVTDRNRDGRPDLLVWTGEALELQVFVLLGDASGRFGAPGPVVIVAAPLVPHGPVGLGLWMADVNGDGLEDLITQDAASADKPRLNLFVSESATRIGTATQLDGLGFEFADVDGDGTTDIVTTRAERLVALLRREHGFDAHDLGVSSGPPLKDFVVDPGVGGLPQLVMLYDLSGCPTCEPGCAGRCIHGSCVGCLSDDDCAGARCVAQACTP
jgi:hypothetical protein